MINKIIETLRPDKETPKILRQLTAEFAVPLVIALLWTGHDWYKAEVDYAWASKGAINFFAAAWGFSQWNRVKKQNKNEKGISGVMKNTESLIRQVNSSAEKMLGAATGGDSFCMLKPSHVTPLVPSSLLLHHVGDFPLYDLDVRVVDLERFKEVGQNSIFENITHYDVLVPDHVTGLLLTMKPSLMLQNEIRRYNIFYTARNGSFNQSLQMQFINGRLSHASRFTRNDEVFFEDADVGYPKNSNGSIDWSAND
jgi:hypothetical protein